LLIAIWFALAAYGGPLFGRIEEVSDNDPTAYLPSSAEATQVQKQLSDFLGDDAIPAILLVSSDREITEDELGQVQGLTQTLSSEISGVVGSSPAIPSEDAQALQVFVSLDATSDIKESVVELEEFAAEHLPPGLAYYITGPAGFTADLSTAFAGIDGLLLGVALAAVLVILLVVYRSPILPFAVLFTSLFALCGALAAVFTLAQNGVIMLNGQTQGILFILVIGAATDYGLLYVSRYREELRRHPGKWDATKAAIKGSFEPILASGGTVIAGLLCLLLSQLQSNRDLGPIAAIGIVFAMLAAFTLLPALLLLCGRAAYWPRRPHFNSELGVDEEVPSKGMWAKLPSLISRRPRTMWLSTTVILALACLGLIGLKADGVAQSELVLGTSQARDGQVELAKHFPGGSGSPAYVIAPESKLDEDGQELLTHEGVASVALTARDAAAGSVGYTADGLTSFGQEEAEPTVAQGNVLFQVTLADAFDSEAAQSTVMELRNSFGSDVLVGGTTATNIDSNDASLKDRALIIPIILSVIIVILGLLLRSIVAPLLLIATTVLSFGSALGVSALVFNEILGFPGADPAVPLFAFVFLVALGIDYNIFLMTRVREESLHHGTHQGISRGLAITGGVITSAGLVLAATFAALAVIPILFLVQLAFIVAFGVLLDTFVVRTILVPALGYDIGRKIWWPSALAQGKE
jgi:RND superfamily putative drug exporter